MNRRDALQTDPQLRNVPVLAIAAFAAVSLFFVPNIFNDPDTYWHLASGDWILTHGTVPKVDPFSWSFAGRPWSAHEWLSEVLMALAFRVAGWKGVALMTGLAAGAVLAVIGVYLRDRLSARTSLVFLVFVVFGMAPSLLARPHILALPLLMLWTRGLLEARAHRRKPSLWLLPLMALWANLHASFIVGIALLAAFALEAVLDEPRARVRTLLSWGLFGAAALLLALLNPQTWRGFVYPFQVMNMDALPSIIEWRSASFSKVTPFEVVLLEGVFFAIWAGIRVPAVRALVLVGLMHLALSQVRQQIIFITVAALLLRDPFAVALRARLAGAAEERDVLQNKVAACALAAAFAVAICVRLALPLVREDDDITPRTALASVPAALTSRPVLNAYNFGGYLIFRGVRPFIDGRADMYGDAFVARYNALRSAPAAQLEGELDARKVSWTLLEAEDPLIGRLDHLAGWRRLYADKYAVVHVRIADEAGAAPLEPVSRSRLAKIVATASD